jgi:5-methylcytosine-specific restriction endonuclease McrA
MVGGSFAQNPTGLRRRREDANRRRGHPDSRNGWVLEWLVNKSLHEVLATLSSPRCSIFNMKIDSIKKHLAPYSIYQKRHTTISHAFASALAPVDDYDEEKLQAALRTLGQEDLTDIRCVYCSRPAQTWDHLVCLVKKGELNGYGHQIGNLVPSCKDCNSSKGSKDFRVFVAGLTSFSDAQKKRLLSRLEDHQQLAKPFKAGESPAVIQGKLERLKALKARIFELMKQADAIAAEIKEKV